MINDEELISNVEQRIAYDNSQKEYVKGKRMRRRLVTTLCSLFLICALTFVADAATGQSECEKPRYIFLDSYKIVAETGHTDIVSCATDAGLGKITVRPHGGQAPYTVKLKLGDASSSHVQAEQQATEYQELVFDGLEKGTYTIVITDAHCSSEAIYPEEISQPDPVVVTLTGFEFDENSGGTNSVTVEIGGSKEANGYRYVLVNN